MYKIDDTSFFHCRQKVTFKLLNFNNLIFLINGVWKWRQLVDFSLSKIGAVFLF